MRQLFSINIPLIKRYLFLFILGCLLCIFSSIASFEAQANSITPKCKTAFSSEESEFENFLRQPRRSAINKVKRKNRWLRLRDSRPEFNDREAYTNWLIERQRAGRLPENPYGYQLRETREPVDKLSARIFQLPESWVKIRHESVPRIVPAWINNALLLTNDPQTWRQYMEWAEEYYKKSKSYPPSYLNHIKDQIRFRMVQPAGDLFGGSNGFKEDRRLKDVAFSLGGQRTTGEMNATNSKLIALIRNLKEEDKWLDGGTGFGLVLEDAILGLSQRRPIEGIPHTLGITYHPKFTDVKEIESLNVTGVSYMSSPKNSRLPEELSGKHQIWTDRLFQDIPIEELRPRAKLITDFFGVYFYSNDPATVVSKYLNVLHKDGTIGIAYNGQDIVRVGNKEIPIYEWLRSVSSGQISVEHGQSWIRSPASRNVDKEGYIEIGYMLIRNLSGQPVELPKLEMVGFGETIESNRVFRPSADIMHQ